MLEMVKDENNSNKAESNATLAFACISALPATAVLELFMFRLRK
jgi:hypothetical protein